MSPVPSTMDMNSIPQFPVIHDVPPWEWKKPRAFTSFPSNNMFIIQNIMRPSSLDKTATRIFVSGYSNKIKTELEEYIKMVFWKLFEHKSTAMT